jgi:hypothetical protein
MVSFDGFVRRLEALPKGEPEVNSNMSGGPIMKEVKRTCYSLAAVLGASTVCFADPHEVTFDNDGTALIKCACILATSACASSLGDAADGWAQS